MRIQKAQTGRRDSHNPAGIPYSLWPLLTQLLDLLSRKPLQLRIVNIFRDLQILLPPHPLDFIHLLLSVQRIDAFHTHSILQRPTQPLAPHGFGSSRFVKRRRRRRGEVFRFVFSLLVLTDHYLQGLSQIHFLGRPGEDEVLHAPLACFRLDFVQTQPVPRVATGLCFPTKLHAPLEVSQPLAKLRLSLAPDHTHLDPLRS
mmetsp:Transcript_3287/g.6129  ORF Transcript_3287/g.6129 Transcript_3287/m.6129 type:complete len:201 (-) Transcript_3287:1916-2518(-)